MRRPPPNKPALLLSPLLLAVCAKLAGALPLQAKAAKPLVVSWDGAQRDAVTIAREPTFDALRSVPAGCLAAGRLRQAGRVFTGVDVDPDRGRRQQAQCG